MKKRLLSFILVLIMVIGIMPSTIYEVSASSVNAEPTSSSVYINGKKIDFEAYKINGSNYFKLRDLALAFNSTEKKFAISYDDATNTVGITMDSPYVAVGGEMSKGDGRAKIGTRSQSKIFYTKELGLFYYEVSKYYITLDTYLINGNNFVKLRDLLQWIDVGVGYDDKTQAISISTNQGYVLPKFYGNPLAGAEVIDNKYRSDFGQTPGSIHNNSQVVYDGGWYYHTGYKVQEGGTAVGYVTYGQYVLNNTQVYGNYIFADAISANTIDKQYVVRINTDGTGFRVLYSDAANNGNNITVYKGKLYANTKKGQIVSYNLDGTNKQVVGTSGVGPRIHGEIDTYHGYHIYNDRIYTSGGGGTATTVWSTKLDGTDRTPVNVIDNRPEYIVCVYDDYIYYQTEYQGLHRMKIGETTSSCVIPGSLNPTQYAVYGDKIVFVYNYRLVGVVNTDGTGRYQFPNAKQDFLKESVTPYGELAVFNSNYIYAQNTVYNSDSAFPGNVYLVGGYVNGVYQSRRGWFPDSTPSINNLTEVDQFSTTPAKDILKDGWYNLRCMNNYLNIDSNGNAELRNTNTKQKFYVEHVVDKYFTIKTTDGRYLGADVDAANNVRIKVVNTPYAWLVRSEYDNDVFSMRSPDFSNMLLNAYGEKNADGTHIIFWDHWDENAPNHAEFRFIPVN